MPDQDPMSYLGRNQADQWEGLLYALDIAPTQAMVVRCSACARVVE